MMPTRPFGTLRPSTAMTFCESSKETWWLPLLVFRLTYRSLPLLRLRSKLVAMDLIQANQHSQRPAATRTSPRSPLQVRTKPVTVTPSVTKFTKVSTMRMCRRFSHSPPGLTSNSSAWSSCCHSPSPVPRRRRFGSAATLSTWIVPGVHTTSPATRWITTANASMQLMTRSLRAMMILYHAVTRFGAVKHKYGHGDIDAAVSCDGMRENCKIHAFEHEKPSGHGDLLNCGGTLENLETHEHEQEVMVALEIGDGMRKNCEAHKFEHNQPSGHGDVLPSSHFPLRVEMSLTLIMLLLTRFVRIGMCHVATRLCAGIHAVMNVRLNVCVKPLLLLCLMP
mmetsp:Transcript_62852/g.183794  ORF Transcript_62852/g.183794 Transcript_62852/m.183794 type:complete len:337 (-) Transcript_62852:299-1309(-)